MRGAAGKPFGRDARRREQNKKRAKTKPFESGRDPVSAASGVDALIDDFNWTNNVLEAELFSRWGSIVGAENAARSEPVSLNNRVLKVSCTSTAWATQFRLMQAEVLGRIKAEFPDLEIAEIRFSGPEAPSWKKGSRSVSGRGPRDTYG